MKKILGILFSVMAMSNVSPESEMKIEAGLSDEQLEMSVGAFTSLHKLLNVVRSNIFNLGAITELTNDLNQILQPKKLILVIDKDRNIFYIKDEHRDAMTEFLQEKCSVIVMDYEFEQTENIIKTAIPGITWNEESSAQATDGLKASMILNAGDLAALFEQSQNENAEEKVEELSVTRGWLSWLS